MDNPAPSASRAAILALFNGRRNARVPCFSGLTNITQAGLDARGLRLYEIHTDASKMARAAATSYELFGWASAVVPTDLCVEAAALGAEIDFRADMPEPMFPLVARPLAATPDELHLDLSRDPTRHERVATVLEAIRLLKTNVGAEVVIGAWVPGPLTLAMQVIELDNVLMDVARAPQALARVLAPLTAVLIQVAQAYRSAGADFLTIHEMGGSPGVIGPRAFERLVLPRLQELLRALPAPRVLSVCGNTNRAVALLAQSGADALNLDQLNDLARTRAILGRDLLLLGNIDPVGTLAQGTADDIHLAVSRALDAGVDAIWPGCDLPPRVPAANMHAMVDAAVRSKAR